jgi:hypothetical protein
VQAVVELEETMVRTTRGLADASLRVAYLVALLRDSRVPVLARALDAVCARAEQAEEAAREVLLSIVDALNDPACAPLLQQLREEAAGESLLALERLVRHPTMGSPRASVTPSDPNQDRIPDYGRGRPLTLGERKQLARRTDRDTMSKLLRDPHPDVIKRLLGNPKITEEDVLVLASKRPCRSDVLAEVARSTRWSHRPRIRLALMLNPDLPPELASPIAGLLMRQELRLVSQSTHVSPAVRALCLEHLERRPPGEFEDESDEPLQ